MSTKILIECPDVTKVFLPRDFKVFPYKTFFNTSFDNLLEHPENVLGIKMWLKIENKIF